MKWYRKPIYIVLGLVLIISFVPVVDMEYLVMVEKQVLEPYTVLEKVQEPYLDADWYEDIVADDSAPWGKRYVLKQRAITSYRTVTKEVTKTRSVSRPVAETRTKRVSLLRYLLR